MSASLERPKLRNIEIFPVLANGRHLLCLRDPQGISEKPLVVSSDAAFIIGHFDGEHAITEIQTAYVRRFGQLILSDKIIELAQTLDAALLLDTPRFREHLSQLIQDFRTSPVRAPSHAGTAYPADPVALGQLMDSFFHDPQGPGFPDATPMHARRIRAIMAPHIDFQRGGPAYAWAYRELLQAEWADVYVILGINHSNGKHLYAVTAKDFSTPLGILPADTGAIEFLRERCGEWVSEEELCHRSEHSIEFQVLFLQHLFGHNGLSQCEHPVRIVPVLCSSFLHCLHSGQSLDEIDEFTQFTTALREFMENSDDRVCLILSVDWSHIGPRFGDPPPLTRSLVTLMESQNRALLERVGALDVDGFLQRMVTDRDCTRIDAVPAVCTMLRSIDLQRGRLLKYDYAIDEAMQSCVSFASMVFE